jgi:tetratricopeptide (TPR) repeat protein
MQARDYAGAKPYFTQALSVEPNLAIAHLNLGAVYQNTGNPAAASEEYHLAIADDTAANGYPVVTQTTDGTTGTVTEIANRNLGRIHTRGVAGSE